MPRYGALESSPYEGMGNNKRNASSYKTSISVHGRLGGFGKGVKVDRAKFTNFLVVTGL